MDTVRNSGVMGTVWRDCNEAGYRHSWKFAHKVPDGWAYWLCRRKGCSVGTRTETRWIRPKGFLRAS
jgi:hypothetical protein